MTCARIADAETAERYVLGHMEENEQASFEEHFFGCDECFASVQTLQQMQVAVKAGPVAAEVRPAAVQPSQPQKATSTAGGISPTWWGLALAASLLLAVVWWQQRRGDEGISPGTSVARDTEPVPAPPAPAPTPGPGAKPSDPTKPVEQPPAGQTPQAQPPAQTPPAAQPQPTPRTEPARPPRDLGALALVVPPAYVPLQTRSTPDAQAQAFAAAMSRYNAKDFGAAVDQLRVVATAQPDAAHVQFFLGISLLMTDRAPEARHALQRAASSGIAPFADEAHFYLAKAALADRDLDRAERELKIAVEREAGPAGEATRLLRELRSR